jgi:hypothetical protein
MIKQRENGRVVDVCLRVVYEEEVLSLPSRNTAFVERTHLRRAISTAV